MHIRLKKNPFEGPRVLQYFQYNYSQFFAPFSVLLFSSCFFIFKNKRLKKSKNKFLYYKITYLLIKNKKIIYSFQNNFFIYSKTNYCKIKHLLLILLYQIYRIFNA